MRILMYDWNSYLQQDIEMVCKEKGVQLDHFSWDFVNKNVDEQFEEWFTKSVECKLYDILFSINYWPMLSKVCESNGIRYVAWCYDNPLNVKHIEDTLGNEVNKVIFFDRIQTEKYKQKGFDTVHYMPLCINGTRYRNITISNFEKERYAADVSFVGSLYESKINEIRGLLDDYTKGYVDASINAQQELYGVYLLDELITEDVIADINQHIVLKNPNTNFKLLKEALVFSMASEVTRRERIMLLTLLGRRFKTKLYSYQSSEIIKGVICCAPVDYIQEMPKVFMASKINLNPVLRCIQSGIPLRALDVMGVGGFLLSSYQIELAELFEHENEMVMYESIEDAIEKARFYLQHDNLRKQIADNGRKKVLEHFTMQKKLEQIFRKD